MGAYIKFDIKGGTVMGKEIPNYIINFEYVEDNTDEIKAFLLKWYVDLAIQQISKLNQQERRQLINKLKLNQEKGQ